MKRILIIVFVALTFSCSKQDYAETSLQMQEIALRKAALKCQNTLEMGWLKSVINLAEGSPQHKGSIYAIQYSSGTVFLHQPWISSCYGCILYDCEGVALTLSEGEKTEIIAGVSPENEIYTSSL